MSSAIVLDRVSKIYDGGVRAVDQVSLDVADGELLVLLGPSGCGKTTLLRMIAGLEDITSGDLFLDGQRATDTEPGDRNVAMVFQHSALYPHLTVRENLAFPLLTAGGMARSALDARVREMAYGLGLEDQLDRQPGTLSGGERQRVAMGRALILRGPTVLLMDEPLASLDIGLRTGLRAEIGAIIRAMRLTTVYVTHDQAEALSLADRIAILRDGALEDAGPPARIYADPATAFAAAFLGSPRINLARATVGIRDGDCIVLDFTSQRLEIPWSDPRRPALEKHDGQPVIVGIRPDALTPARSSAVGHGPHESRLTGRISGLEYYGHEWIARVEGGLRPVDLEAVRERPARAEPDRAPGASGDGDADGEPGAASPADVRGDPVRRRLRRIRRKGDDTGPGDPGAAPAGENLAGRETDAADQACRAGPTRPATMPTPTG